MNKNKNMISKSLLIGMLAGTLSACGGSGGNNDTTPDIETPDIDTELSGSMTGDVIEDTTISAAGTLTLTSNDNVTLNALTDVQGDYGTFNINANGAWSYLLNNDLAAVQALNANETLTDTFTVTTTDNTSTTITITVTGNDEATTTTPTDAIIAGDKTGNVIEDSMLNTNGTLTVTDPDANEEAFVVQTDIQGSHGTFSIDAAGAWTYSLTNDSATIQALNANDTITDTFSITTVDTTSETVTITITGTNEDGNTVTSNGFSQAEGGNYIDGYTDGVPAVNCDSVYDSVSSLKSAASNSLTAGTTLCLADGDYSNDFDIEFGGVGTADAKITIAAENPGQAIISNSEVNIVMSGEHVVLQGFVFKNGSVDFNIIKTFGNSVPCNYCRITENTIVDMDDGVNSTDDSKKWFEIYGSYTRFDHNWVSGKTSRGALLIVDRFSSDWSDSIAASFEVDYTQIDYNYIGDRPPIEGKGYAESSDNEYEGIRIGLSTSHSGDSFSVVENNYFERIQGEAEVVSNKATNNTIRNNTIRDSYGSIVTRHGNTATISNNFIFGDDHPFSGGIRLVDDSHTVTNNYIEGARYLDTNWNGGIVLTTGEGAGDADNGYQNISNVLVANNTIVDSVNSLNVYGGRENTNPDTVYFVNNIIADPIGPVIKNADEMPTNSLFEGNYVGTGVLLDNDEDATLAGMNSIDALLEKGTDGLYRPTANSPSLTASNDPAIASFTLPTIDMDGQTRSSVTTSGADEILTSATALSPLTSADVGPKTYTATPGKIHVEMVNITNHDFDTGDLTGWTSTGAEIETDVEEIFSRGATLKLDSNASSVSQTVDVTANTNYTFSSFVKGTAKLSVVVDGVTYYTDLDSSSYKFTAVTFNSGNATSAVITATVDDFVANKATIENANFDEDQDDWTVVEGTGIGQVQDSDNSSTDTKGSIKFKYNVGDDDGTPHDPYIAQTVNVEANTDYTLSMYQLLKSSHSGSTIRFGVFTEDDDVSLTTATILDEKSSVYNTLENNGAIEGDDSFLQDTLSFNTGANTSLTIFAQFESSTGDEIRVDEFQLSYDGAPTEGTEAFFDSFRLVSHAEAPNGYANNDASSTD